MQWLTVLPPLVAIGIVLWKKEVILALFLAILTSEILLTYSQGMPVFSGGIEAIERIVNVFSSAGNSRILIFSLLIGAVLAFMRQSGGVTAMVDYIVTKGLGKTPRQSAFIANLTGMAIFIESNLCVLTAGILSRGLFDKHKMSRATLAFIIDSTAAPICILVLLNGWGAFVLGLLSNYEFELSAAEILWGTVVLNFYPIIAILMVWYTAFTGKLYGPLARSNAIPQADLPAQTQQASGKARYMLLPLCVLVSAMIGFMFWTGDGVLAQGSGSKSVLYATVLSAVVAYTLLLTSKQFTHQQLIKIGFKGMGELLPLVTIVLFSLALGASLKQLGTGVFIAQLVGDNLPLFLIAPMLFFVGAIIAFSTGTSWGTFAILIPIGVPLIQTLGLPPSLIIAAILGGGVFGDHCSPISDTTAVSALASGCDLLEHVKTQLPYALFGGSVTVIGYTIYGLLLL